MIVDVKIKPGCISCGSCERKCPQIFAVAGKTSSTVKSTDFNGNTSNILQAASRCPVKVIEVVQDSDNKEPKPLRATSFSLVRIIRQLHLYCSILLSLIFAFFALSGFLANRQHLFADESAHKVPDSIELNKAALIKFFKKTHPELMTLTAFHKNSKMVKMNFSNVGGNSQTVVEISPGSRTYDWSETGTLESIDVEDNAALASFFAGKRPGKLDEIDEDEQWAYLHINSVWSSHLIEVNKKKKNYSIKKSESPSLTASLIKLHKGDHSSFSQKILIDVSAFGMLFVVFSGVVIGFQNRSKPFQYRTALLVLVSFVLLLLFLIQR